MLYNIPNLNLHRPSVRTVSLLLLFSSARGKFFSQMFGTELYLWLSLVGSFSGQMQVREKDAKNNAKTFKMPKLYTIYLI